MSFYIEWHQTRLVLTLRWVLAFTLIAPPIGGCWLLVTIIFAPAVYIFAPAAAMAGLIYITIILALEKRNINSLIKRLALAAIIGLAFALPFLLVEKLKLIAAIFACCLGATAGTVMVVENSLKARQIVGLPKESADLYKIDPHYL